ncbi:T-cell surface antigen CD2 isoform X3 [Oncorhynchus kisutch]|uniref:T-cell surface antigen CD2 isoform X3 n=1 Tax=Oncorhynchus kisutch TaxID=8019 RepID=UPI0012DC23DC|nr:T-cell surface antigen CD2-like isoform X3 [Oncorhynchus kisutch]
MEAVLGLLVISAGVSHGLETSCDARQNGSQCYGALGGTVYLQLTDTMAYNHYSFYKGSTDAKTEILRVKDTLVIRETPIKNRVHFFINNGTFRLNNIQRNDSGEYQFEKYDSEGKSSGIRGLQLFIEAPVSSPQLSSECLSHGEMKVSCSSEGDGPQYSWTLDGQTLNDTDAPPDNKTNTITLKKGLSGDLTCTVRNNINRNTVSRRISHCPGLIYVNCTLSNGTKISEWVNATGNTLCVEPTTLTTESPTSKTFTVTKYIGMAAGSLAGVVLVLLMVLAVYCVQKKNKPPSKAQVKGDSQDVEYADVRILRQEMRQKEREAPVEVEYGHVDEACGPQQPVDVEYGQITILEGPRRKVDMPEEEYCMYASVRKGQ